MGQFKEEPMMMYNEEIPLFPEWIPEVLNQWLEQNLPVDLTVKHGRRFGARMIIVRIEGNTTEDLHAKRRAFNALIEAKGYGPLKD